MLELVIYPTLDNAVKEKIDNARTRARNGGATWGHDLKWSRNGPHKGIVEIVDEYEERLAGTEQSNGRDKRVRMKEKMHSQNTNKSQTPMLKYSGDTNNSHNTAKPDFDCSKTGIPINQACISFLDFLNTAKNKLKQLKFIFVLKCQNYSKVFLFSD